MDGTQFDVVIVGGSLGGVSAALSAANQGASVCLLESTAWLGGQFTAQGVTKPDENSYIETVGSSASYRAFRHAVREYYRTTYQLSAEGAAQPLFNPGGRYPGFTFQPLVGNSALSQMLAAFPKIQLLLNTAVTQVQMSGNAIASITATASGGTPVTYTASYYLDATDLGELLPQTGVQGTDWVIGAESQADTGEPLAPPEAHPEWLQAITMPFAIEHRPAGENNTIPEPAEYAQLKQEQNYSIDDGYISTMFVAGKDMWSYRSIIASANFNDPAFPTDLTMINCAANDYQAASIPTGDPAQDAAIIARAGQASLGYLYWLQTECPRDNSPGQFGYPELKLRSDLFNTDGVSAQPYIRESRRIKAVKTVVQQELDVSLTPGPRAALFSDSCGIGYYSGMDVHGCTGLGTPEQFVDARPYQVPLNALIPLRLTNLLPACKNLGVTHLTNGAYRLHPGEWAVGEAAGALAAYSVKNGTTPAAVASTANLLKDLQHTLLAAGVPLFWWTDITFDMPVFSAVHLLGVNGIASGFTDMTYRPGVTLSDSDKTDFAAAAGQTLIWPDNVVTRGDAATWLVSKLGL